jgi:PAS domain S-box-containing protein
VTGFGQMPAMVAAFDWSKTAIGAQSTWPQSLRTAVEICLSSKIPMFVWWGPELIHIYNDGYAVTLGKRHPGALGVPAKTIWPEVWQTIQEDLDAMVVSGVPITRVRLPLTLERNGYPEEGFFTYSYSSIHDESGKIGGFMQVCYEETEIVHAQRERDRIIQELKVERANLQAIVDEAPAFIAMLRGPTHVFEHANQLYIDLVSGRKLIGKTVGEALPEVIGQGFIELLDKVYSTGQPYVGTETLVMVDVKGTLEARYLNFVYQPMRGVDGNVTGIFVHGVDMTPSVLARRALEDTEQRRRLALDSAELGSWQLDFTSQTLTTDKRFRQIFWASEGEQTYEKALDAIHPDDITRVRAAVNVTMTSDKSVPYEVEHRVIHPDGSVHWVFVKGRSNVEADSGRTQRSLNGTILDITDRKRIEAEREELLDAERVARREAETSGRIKDEFLATLSHEIRTPLNAILGWSQIMQHATRPEDVTHGLAVIERNARAQAQIVEDLLDMSSIISGKVRLDVKRLNLSNIVSNAVETARPTAEAKGVRIESIIDPLHGVEVSGDANRLQQVLWNLISNAIKFTPRDGKVQVLLERVNSHLEISVIDTGEGITADFLPYVFDRFRQADASTTRRHGGLGIGLSIVRQLVELHGGSVRVKSAGLKQGSTFVVALPLIAIGASEESSPRTHPRVSEALPQLPSSNEALADLRVLVIDDEPDARALVKRLLEDYGATVIETAVVDTAVSRIEQGDVDILVSDIGMPDEDGYSLIKRVRALGADRNGGIPAIALTAYARSEDRVRAIAAGFQMHLTKPVEPVELITIVASAAGRRILDV